jgi:hypothetical protein
VGTSSVSADELKCVFLATKTPLSDGGRVETVLEKGGAPREALMKEYLGKTDAALQAPRTPGLGRSSAGLFGLPLSVRQTQQTFLLPGFRPSLLDRRAPAPGSKCLMLPRRMGPSMVGRSLQRGLVMSISPTPRMPYLSNQARMA